MPVRDAPGDQPSSARPVDPRRKIRDALIETVLRAGHDHTCVEHVCSAANVPEPVFDEYFESIEDCFIQASDELIGELELTVLRSMYGEAPWPERIRRGLRTLLSTIAEHPDRARFALIECVRAGEGAAERLRAAESVFVPIIEEGEEYATSVEGLSVEHLSELTSEGIVGGIASIVHRRVLQGDTEELPALLGDLLYFALMPYLGHDRALASAV
jgi:AcrR family transcriptional regulator